MYFRIIVMLFLLPAALPAQPYGLEERIPNTSLIISTSGDTLADMELVEIFGNLSFSRPVYMTHSGDQSNRLFIVEKRGVITVFENDTSVTDSRRFLDIESQVNDSPSEAGLLSVAFHPDYRNNGRFYVYYTFGSLNSRISEFTVSTDPDSADHASERILLELAQPYSNHNGGQLAFGPDRFLYIGFGDGGSGGDPLNNGQDTQTLHGAVLRIDVDSRTDSTAYGIPAGNPFAGTPQLGRAEIWAWGLRNPWRFSFDPVTGILWAGDVGQGQWEEIDIIEGGKNYGWNIMEGFHCYSSESCDTTGLTLPVVEYSHSVGKSVTGGFVYRSDRLERLQGVYLYGDYVTAKIWGLKYEDGEVLENRLIAESPALISSFGIDEQGEVYVVGYNGRIFRFEEKPDTPPVDSVPHTISESGLYSDMNTRTVSPGIIPYSVNISFWSDEAFKERFIALPDTTKIVFSADSAWVFPPGAVIVKNFYLERIAGDSTSRQLLETRFLVQSTGDELWSGYSYWWNEEGSDAQLLDSSAVREFSVQQADTIISRKWYYPSRSECLVCHTPAAGHVLGLRTVQINKQHSYDGISDNQLRSYNHIRLFTEDIGEDYSDMPRFPALEDAGVAVQTRARAYLDVNCANCHLEGGSGRTNMDLRYHIPLESAHLIDVPASLDNLGLENALRINPGEPDSSVLYLRMIRRNGLGMPPLASFLVDEEGASLVSEWIDSLAMPVFTGNPEPRLPEHSILFPAFPNPFNAETRFRFYIPRADQVLLTVYDIRGREIGTFFRKRLGAGYHTAQLEAGNLASGVYVIQLRAGHEIRSRKCVVIK